MISCSVCKSNNITMNVSKIENIWPDSRDVAYCLDCNVYFLQKVPSLEELEDYYKNEYYQYPSLIAKIKPIFRNFRCSSQYNYVNTVIGEISQKNILEVGAGDGNLLHLFSKNNYVTGIEYSKKYTEYARKKYHIDLIDIDFFELNKKYDLILMSHVLEHFIDVNRVMEKTRELLNDGGHLFIEVPNSPTYTMCSKSDLNTFGLSWTTGHIYSFTSKSLQILSLNHGFNVISMDRFNYNFSHRYSEAKKKRLAEILMAGSGVGLQYLPSLINYFSKSLISPKNSYAKVKQEHQFSGWGDNMRLILKK